MKTIPKAELTGAETLTPLQMNAIHFDTGDKSHLLDADTLASATSAAPAPQG